MFTSVARYSLGFGHLGVKVTNLTEIGGLFNNSYPFYVLYSSYDVKTGSIIFRDYCPQRP
jgi:hypothetical protein